MRTGLSHDRLASRADAARPASSAPPPVFSRSRLTPPRTAPRPIGLEARRRWIEAIFDHELCLVRALAGHGKSTLCADWFVQLRAAGTATAWISLGAEDNEAAAIAYLFEAVRQTGGDDTDGAVSLDGATGVPSFAAARLANAIEQIGRPFVLFLDGIDRIGDSDFLACLDHLISHCPINFHLVLPCRRNPRLSVERIAERGMLLTIDTQRLRLCDEEAAELLVAAGLRLTEPDVAALNAAVLGWCGGLDIAAAVLAAGAARPRSGDWAASLASWLTDYFNSAIWGPLPAPARYFLQRCAIASTLTPALAAVLTGDQTSAAQLRAFATDGLFLEQLPGSSEHYRLHPCFRAFLRARLDESDGSAIGELQRRASRWFADQGQFVDAIELALEAGDGDAAAPLILRAAMPMIAQSDLLPLIGWIERLERLATIRLPALLPVKAWALTLAARHDAGGAIAALDGVDLRDRAAHELLHLVLVQNRLEEAEVRGHALLDEVDGGHDFATAMVRALMAHCALRRGAHAQVHELVRPVLLHAPRRRQHLALAYALSARSSSHWAEGQPAEAERVLRDGHIRLVNEAGERSSAAALVAALLARLYYERDEIALAAELLDRHLPVIEQSSFQHALIRAQMVAVRTAASAGDTDRAAALIERGELIAFERNWLPMQAMCVVERTRLGLPQTIDPESIVAVSSEEDAIGDPLAQRARALALLSEMRAYEAIANGDRPRLTAVADRLARLGTEAKDMELKVRATLFNILPQLSGRCDKMIDIETVRFLNQAVSAGFRRTIVDLLEITGVRPVQNFAGEAYSAGSFLALLRMINPLRPEATLASNEIASNSEALSFLTMREIEILGALNNGESNKEIARNLRLTPETVKWHLKNVMRKLRANSREEAVRNASTLGLAMSDGVAKDDIHSLN